VLNVRVLNTKQEKRGGLLLFKAHQEPKSMQGIAKQYPVAVEARDDALKSTPPLFLPLL
jgi:hypothetical protein